MAKNKTQQVEEVEESTDNGNGKRKKVCPVNRAEFRNFAKPVTVSIGGVPFVASVKEFSTGSLGWYLSGRTVIEVNGTPVECQVGLNLTAVGSKELPRYDGDGE